MKGLFWDYIKNTPYLNKAVDVDFTDRAFAYDYNEVQESFFDPNANYYVILAGETGLRKRDMLGRICQDIINRGEKREDILFLDFDIPILHEVKVEELIEKFCIERADSKQLYLIVNEIQECGDWCKLFYTIRCRYENLKVLVSSSTPSCFYETVYDKKIDFCKIIVLSKKNFSNIKYESQTFGVYKEFKYNIKNGIAEIKGLTEDGKQMQRHQIPSHINGVPVKIIASGAFHDRGELHSIEIPETIEMIGDYAFSKCCNLEEISFPASLMHIGDHAFLGAKKLCKIYGGENIAHIGVSAFYDTAWLRNSGDFATLGITLYKYKGKGQQEPVLPCDIRTISNYAFADSSIERIDCTQISEIGEGAFYCCRSLKEITIALKRIPPFAFYGCKTLYTSFSVEEVGKFALCHCSALTSVDAKIVDVCGLAFCENLTGVGNVERLSCGALYSCRGISESAWCQSVIYASRFAVAKLGIVDAQFTRAEKIDDYALYACKNIEAVSINEKCTIGESILFDCDKVKTMDISGNCVLSSYFGGVRPNVEQLTVRGNVLDNFCRDNNTLKRVTLVDIARFGRWCFYNNAALSIVNIKNVYEIGDWAFAYCDSIKEIVLSESVSYIGMNAFRYCHNLLKVSLLHSSAIHFGANAFYSIGKDKCFFVPKSLIEDYKKLPEWREYIKDLKNI